MSAWQRMLLALALACASLAAAGCGRTGDLRLPEDDAAAAADTAQ